MSQDESDANQEPHPTPPTVDMKLKSALSNIECTSSLGVRDSTTTTFAKNNMSNSNSSRLSTPSSSALTGTRSDTNQEGLPTSLSAIGIKVRDFAYESTLPQLASVLSIPLQVQPEPRPLKRTRDSEWSNVADSTTSFPRRIFYFDSEKGGSSSQAVQEWMEPKPVTRRDTEPYLPSSQSPMREIGHSAASFSVILSQMNDNSPEPSPSSPSRSKFAGALDIPEHSQPRPTTSQTSGNWIDTPVVTPNGSSQRTPFMDSSANRLPALGTSVHSEESRDITPLYVPASGSESSPSPPRPSAPRPSHSLLRTPPKALEPDQTVLEPTKDQSPRYHLRSRTRLGKLPPAGATARNTLVSPPSRKGGTRASTRARNRTRPKIAQQ